MVVFVCQQFDMLFMFLLLLDANRVCDGIQQHRNSGENGSKNVSTSSVEAIKTKIPTIKRERRNNTVVEEQVGTSATLECDVFLPDVTVIWVKKEETGDVLLTANDSTTVDDMRFLSVHEKTRNIWKLRIRYTEFADNGTYECQICDPVGQSTFSIYVHLSLVVSFAEILGGNRTVKSKMPLRLICILHRSREKASYIFWYRNETVINYNLGLGAAVRESRLGSELIFQKAEPELSGNYSCVPSNAIEASVFIEVIGPKLSDQHSSAQTDNSGSSCRYGVPFMTTIGILGNILCLF